MLAGALALVLGTPTTGHAAAIPGLFNTGVGTNGALLAAGAVDPHYRLIQSADPGAPLPNAYTPTDAPIPPWIADGPASKWISPSATVNRAPGDYVFRLAFSLAGLDADTAVITGRWSTDNQGVGIRLNGLDTGIGYDGNFSAISGVWTINTGFVEGTNTLDFVVNNAGTSANPIGLRVELSGTAEPPLPPGTPPSITSQPVSVTVALQDPASFSVKARGGKPLSYRWRHNGTPIAGATNSSFSIASVSVTDRGAYDVVLTNIGGSITSAPAQLNVVFARPGWPAAEPLGHCSRRTGLVMSEIMYHPRARADGRNLEFIELYNANPWAEDLSGWRLGGDVDWTFPAGTSIAGLGFLVVAPAPADVQAVYGLSGVLGGFTNSLPNSAGTVRLLKRSGAIVLAVTYSDQPPWPAAADGAGHSLALARPSYGERSPLAWAASAFIGGSPGGPDPIPASAEDNVLINELLAHTPAPLVDFLELHNASPFIADLSGCWLSDDPATNKFRIPNGTVLPPQGFVAFDETQLGFGLSADGEAVFLVNSNQTRVMDVVRFPGQAAGVSWGRHPDGAPGWEPLASRTSGTNNAPAVPSAVVINEIMFHPLSGDSDEEFVELFNRGPGAADLSGWRFTEGISFVFPSNSLLAAGGYLVVARNRTNLLARHPGLAPSLVVGDFGGNLSNGGERLALARPETAVTTNAANGQVTTNTWFVVRNEVTWLDKSRWSRLADGGGSSLELVDARADTRLMAHWADSDESAKASWTPVEFTGTVDNAMPGVNADQVQLFLMGEGEALVDDVEVVYGGVNRVPNPGFESGITGWVFQGTQIRTGWETNAGYNSARALRLRASDRGEPIGNRVRAPLNTSIPLGSTVTLRAKVRWRAGAPEFLMRLRGGGLEATARLNVPANLGTPGAPNSRARANAGPAITGVTHRPVLPLAGQSFRVTARVQDRDGLAGVTLRYRLDPSPTFSSLTMRDDGTGDDALRADGIYTATIPGQPQGTMVAFYIEATDAFAPAASARFPPDAPARECLVLVGDTFVAGPFSNYRIWMTQATLNTWSTRGNLSNDPLDVTFAYHASRVIYNAGGLYGGSPAWSPGYNSPVGNICAYDVLLPGDDTLFNEDHLSLDLPIRDPTNQREQLMHWFADQYDLPNLYRRDIYLFVNGYRRATLYHDTQQPGGDLLEEWFTDDPDGTLIKSTQWSEGTDAGAPDQILLNSLERFTSGGALKTARYRWNWRRRATDSQLDYTNFFSLVEAVNAPTNAYQSTVEGLVNVEDWMRMFAMNDLCSYWDGFGNPNAKNTYLYKPTGATWRLIPWDFDVGLGVFGDPPTAPLFPSNVDPMVQRMYNFPAFVRAYWRELEHGVNTFFQSGVVTPMLTARDEAYRTNGLNFTSPFVASGESALSIPAWMDARRAYLQTQLAGVAATFSVLSPTNFSTNRNFILLSGRAPVGVRTLTVNGVPYPVIWTGVTSWTLQVPVTAGTNLLALAGLDRFGNVLPNTLRTITVNFTGADEPAGERVVLNEIMYHPAQPGASYVELFNRSTNNAFDLSGWRLNGLDYIFPSGAVLGPRAFLVLANDREDFARANGTGVPVFGTFDGWLDNDGEVLTLFKPGPGAGEESVVDRVLYEDAPPWPAGADGSGAALQLVDADQDNSRVSNWSDGSGWRFFSYTGTPGTFAGTRLSFYFDAGGGDIYLDDVAFVPGGVAGAGSNYLANGGFEAPLEPAWVVTGLATNSALVADRAHSGAACLRLVFNAGAPQLTYFYQDLLTPTVTNQTYTLSFWYLLGSRGTNLTARLNAVFRPILDLRAAPPFTPGTTNSVLAALPPYPPLWLNECQADNLTGPTNRAGLRGPWLELFNAGSNSLSLEGCFLASNYANLTQWAFPSNATIGAGQFLVVWADGRPDLSSETELHTSFSLGSGTGAVAFSRLVGATPQILDYLNYRDLPADWSWGAVPDGQSFWRRAMFRASPGATNNGAAPPVTVFINEWLAANTSASGIADPADGNFDDWFELYNPAGQPADLAGHYLTDALGNWSKYRVPTGYVVPPRGFLLVWADEETDQNRPDQPDLHVSFKLSQGGESIGLFAPDGTRIDSVEFGPQTNNVSQGRWPDGAAAFYFMPTPTPRALNVIPTPPPPPELGGVLVLPDGSVQFTFSTVPGHTYRVEYTDDLNAPTWTWLPPDLVAGGASLTITQAVEGRPQRFYRVVLVQ